MKWSQSNHLAKLLKFFWAFLFLYLPSPYCWICVYSTWIGRKSLMFDDYNRILYVKFTLKLHIIMKSVIVITRHSYQIWRRKKWQMIETKWNETNTNECTCTLRIEMENRVFAHRHSLPLSQICNTLTRFTSYIVCSYPWCESQKYFLLSPDDSTRCNDNRAECGFCNILTAIKVKGLKLVTIWIQNDSI